MDTALKKTISTAIVQLLRPLVKILLRNGVPYGTFCELAKWVYVDVASSDFTIKGRKQTDSRVSVITGLNRKEVRRIKGITGYDDLAVPEKHNRAVRVINGWRSDKRFVDKKGNPKVLPIEGTQISFSSLVKDYSGDIPVRAIIDEMMRSGVIEMKSGKIKLLTKGYIVRSAESDKIHILGTQVGELIYTINHNLSSDTADAFFQRRVSYDNIPDEALPKLRKIVSEMSEEFTDSINKIMASYDKDTNPAIKEKGDGKKAGLGIFYFE